jgi:hypothetical protein
VSSASSRPLFALCLVRPRGYSRNALAWSKKLTVDMKLVWLNPLFFLPEPEVFFKLLLSCECEECVA